VREFLSAAGGVRVEACREVNWMNVKVRRARLSDLDSLVGFAFEEAREAEGAEKAPTTLRVGIEAALRDAELALYWVLVDERDEPVGNISALREWSNWNAGSYWWVQSLYISPAYRGAGYLSLLLDAVAAEARRQGGLDLRLYVHEENARARTAYRRAGFAEMHCRIMRREL
jgi:GNAT superfamily N-acetyltransferase